MVHKQGLFCLQGFDYLDVRRPLYRAAHSREALAKFRFGPKFALLSLGKNLLQIAYSREYVDLQKAFPIATIIKFCLQRNFASTSSKKIKTKHPS